jgi:hypothetical protein
MQTNYKDLHPDVWKKVKEEMKRTDKKNPDWVAVRMLEERMFKLKEIIKEDKK